MSESFRKIFEELRRKASSKIYEELLRKGSLILTYWVLFACLLYCFKYVIDSVDLPALSSVEILGITINEKLNVNSLIHKICLRLATPRNFWAKVSFREWRKKVLSNSFFHSNFNFYPLVWMLENAISVIQMQILQCKWSCSIKSLVFHVKW